MGQKKKEQSPEFFKLFHRCITATTANVNNSNTNSNETNLEKNTKIKYQRDYVDAGFATTVPKLVTEFLKTDDRFLNLDDSGKRKLIYENLRPSMTISGRLNILSHGSLLLNIENIVDHDNSIFSDVHMLNIEATCPADFWGDGPNDPLPFDFRRDMLVKAVIVKVPDNYNEPILVSFSHSPIPLLWKTRQHSLGYIRNEENELLPNRREYRTYNSALRSDGALLNPASISVMMRTFGVPDDLSLLHSHDFNGKYIEVLRADKLHKWALDRIHIGNNYYRQKAYSRAIDMYREAINMSPKCSQAYFAISFVYYDINKLDDAYRNIKKALDLDPNNKKAELGLLKIEDRAKKRGVSLYEVAPSQRGCDTIQQPNTSQKVIQYHPTKEESSHSSSHRHSLVQLDESPFKRLEVKPKMIQSQSYFGRHATGTSSRHHHNHSTSTEAPYWLTDLNAMVPDISHDSSELERYQYRMNKAKSHSNQYDRASPNPKSRFSSNGIDDQISYSNVSKYRKLTNYRDDVHYPHDCDSDRRQRPSYDKHYYGSSHYKDGEEEHLNSSRRSPSQRRDVHHHHHHHSSRYSQRE